MAEFTKSIGQALREITAGCHTVSVSTLCWTGAHSALGSQRALHHLAGWGRKVGEKPQSEWLCFVPMYKEAPTRAEP